MEEENIKGLTEINLEYFLGEEDMIETITGLVSWIKPAFIEVKL